LAEEMYHAPCLVHFHIPRTRGTWLRQSLILHLLKYCRADQIYFVNGSSEWGCAHGSYVDLCQLPKYQLSRLRLITGHMPISVLDLIPDVFCFTVLRDPVERSLSDYWFCHCDTSSPAHSFARTLSPVEFCRRGYSQARNGHARFLSGVAYAMEPLSDNELLRAAAQNLTRFNLVGMEAEFDQFIQGLGIVGVRGMEMIGSRNAINRLRHVTSEERQQLRRENWVDYQLFHVPFRGRTGGC
jgi:hypothetical protein